MRTNVVLVSLVALVCGAGCKSPHNSAPPEPVDTRPWCERIDYDWATPSEPQPTTQPTTTPASVSLFGFSSIDKEMIKKPIQANKWAIDRCYEMGLEHDPNLQGRVAIRFDIEPVGRVGAIEIVEDTLDDPCVARCVAEVGKRLWSWPRIAGSGTITITYPFLFIAP